MMIVVTDTTIVTTMAPVEEALMTDHPIATMSPTWTVALTHQGTIIMTHIHIEVAVLEDPLQGNGNVFTANFSTDRDEELPNRVHK